MALRDGKCPMPYEPSFRPFIRFTAENTRLRWDRRGETVNQYLTELRSILLCALENGLDNGVIQDLILEGLLELVAQIPKCQDEDRVNSMTAAYHLLQYAVDLETKTSTLYRMSDENVETCPAALTNDVPQMQQDLLIRFAREEYDAGRDFPFKSDSQPPLKLVLRRTISLRAPLRALSDHLLAERLHAALKKHVKSYADACASEFPELESLPAVETIDEIVFFWTPLDSSSRQFRLLAFLTPEGSPCLVQKFVDHEQLMDLQCRLENIADAEIDGVKEQLAQVCEVLGARNMNSESLIKTFLAESEENEPSEETPSMTPETLTALQNLSSLLQGTKPSALCIVDKQVCSFLGALLQHAVVN